MNNNPTMDRDMEEEDRECVEGVKRVLNPTKKLTLLSMDGTSERGTCIMSRNTHHYTHEQKGPEYIYFFTYKGRVTYCGGAWVDWFPMV